MQTEAYKKISKKSRDIFDTSQIQTKEVCMTKGVYLDQGKQDELPI